MDETEPEISVDEMWVDMFGLKLGDTLTLRIGEREQQSLQLTAIPEPEDQP